MGRDSEGAVSGEIQAKRAAELASKVSDRSLS